MDADGYDGAALVVMTFSRGELTPEEAARVGAARAGLGAILREEADVVGCRSFDLVPGANGNWSGGGVDVIRVADLAPAAVSAVRARQQQSLPDAASCRLFGTRAFTVLAAGTAGTHLFSHGRYTSGYERAAGHARWKVHSELLKGTQWYADHVLGFTQLHAVSQDEAERFGLDDTDGIAHLTHASIEARQQALLLPEHAAVVRPDEDEFFSRDRGMRVFTYEVCAENATAA